MFKRITAIFRPAILALMGAPLLFAQPLAQSENESFPRANQVHHDEGHPQIRELVRQCEEAGHQFEVLSYNKYATESCVALHACRFRDEPHPTRNQEGQTGCFIFWDGAGYLERHPGYIQGRVFKDPYCWWDNGAGEHHGEERDWRACRFTVPVCERPKIRMMNGQLSENPFAPCVDHPSRNNDRAAVAGVAPPDAEINQRGRGGRTKLHSAAARGEADRTEELLRQGADPNIRDDGDKTALHLAAQANQNQADIARMLLEGGADANAQDEDGRTPAYYAVGANSPDDAAALLELLLDHNANMNLQDNNGNTPLHLAAHRAPADIVEILLGGGADKNAANRRGLSPLDIATRRRRDEIVALMTP